MIDFDSATDYLPDLDSGGDTAWYTDVWDWTTDTASDAFNYINTNEWAANLLSGAAAGAGAYLLQEDRQKHERELMREKQRFEVDVNKISPASGGAASGAVYAGGLMGGALTNGAIAQKKVK